MIDDIRIGGKYKKKLKDWLNTERPGRMQQQDSPESRTHLMMKIWNQDNDIMNSFIHFIFLLRLQVLL